jgi:hypothetical protein
MYEPAARWLARGSLGVSVAASATASAAGPSVAADGTAQLAPGARSWLGRVPVRPHPTGWPCTVWCTTEGAFGALWADFTRLPGPCEWLDAGWGSCGQCLAVCMLLPDLLGPTVGSWTICPKSELPVLGALRRVFRNENLGEEKCSNTHTRPMPPYSMSMGSPDRLEAL